MHPPAWLYSWVLLVDWQSSYKLTTQNTLAGRFRRGGPAGKAGRVAVAEVPLSAAGGQYVGGAVVLAAKVLTESDAKGRVILPRAMVENNLAWFVGTYRCLTVMYTVRAHLHELTKRSVTSHKKQSAGGCC